MGAYRHPEYYDIAFAVGDATHEVGFFETAIREFSRAPVRRVLEIACGTAPAQTDHECITLDVDDQGIRQRIDSQVRTKIFFPQQYLCLVELSRDFESVGWFNAFALDAVVTPKGRHFAILRRR